jgi:hypothetical protein
MMRSGFLAIALSVVLAGVAGAQLREMRQTIFGMD